MECEKIIRFTEDDGAFDTWLNSLTAKNLVYIDFNTDEEIDFNDEHTFSEKTYNRIMDTVKKPNEKIYKKYIYQESSEHNENLNLTPIGTEDIITKHLILEYGINEIILYLNPDINNPKMFKEVEQLNDISQVSKEFITELSDKVIEKVGETFNSLSMNILNSNFSEDEIQTIFKNLSNSAILKVILIMTPEFFESVKLLSDDSKSLISKLSRIGEVETKLEKLEKSIEEADIKIENIENRTENNENELIEELVIPENKIETPVITEKFISELFENAEFNEKLLIAIESKLEEQMADNE